MLNKCSPGSDLSSEFIASTESLIDAAQQNHSGVKLAHPEWCRTAAKGPIDCRGLKLFFLQHLRGAPVGRSKGKGERTKGRLGRGVLCELLWCDGKVFVESAADRIWSLEGKDSAATARGSTRWQLPVIHSPQKAQSHGFPSTPNQ